MSIRSAWSSAVSSLWHSSPGSALYPSALGPTGSLSLAGYVRDGCSDRRLLKTATADEAHQSHMPTGNVLLLASRCCCSPSIRRSSAVGVSRPKTRCRRDLGGLALAVGAGRCWLICRIAAESDTVCIRLLLTWSGFGAQF